MALFWYFSLDRERKVHRVYHADKPQFDRHRRSPHHGAILHLIRDLSRGRADGGDPEAAEDDVHEPIAVGEDLVDRCEHRVQRVLILGAAARQGQIQLGGFSNKSLASSKKISAILSKPSLM